MMHDVIPLYEEGGNGKPYAWMCTNCRLRAFSEDELPSLYAVDDCPGRYVPPKSNEPLVYGLLALAVAAAAFLLTSGGS